MALTRLLVVVCLSLASCGDPPTLAGTYVGEGEGYYQLVGAESPVSFKVPNETVVVKLTGRHYDAYEYTVMVRGCAILAADHGGVKKQKYAQFLNSQLCTFDIPGIGHSRASALLGDIREGASSSSDLRFDLSSTEKDPSSNVVRFSYHVSRARPL